MPESVRMSPPCSPSGSGFGAARPRNTPRAKTTVATDDRPSSLRESIRCPLLAPVSLLRTRPCSTRSRGDKGTRSPSRRGLLALPLFFEATLVPLFAVDDEAARHRSGRSRGRQGREETRVSTMFFQYRVKTEFREMVTRTLSRRTLGRRVAGQQQEARRQPEREPETGPGR